MEAKCLFKQQPRKGLFENGDENVHRETLASAVIL